MKNQAKILVVSSHYYENLSQIHLQKCEELLKKANYQYQVEHVSAGCYEIPAVMQHYHQHNPFDAYITLGLLLKGSTDHYEFIWEHLKECFIQFTLQGMSIGNAIISAPSMEILTGRVENGERVQEAVAAADYLIKLKSRVS